jgi:hypothetical protein
VKVLKDILLFLVNPRRRPNLEQEWSDLAKREARRKALAELSRESAANGWDDETNFFPETR